jgi:hypothetical protein
VEVSVFRIGRDMPWRGLSGKRNNYTMFDVATYGREMIHQLLPQLRRESTHSILCGDWLFCRTGSSTEHAQGGDRRFSLSFRGVRAERLRRSISADSTQAAFLN